MLGFAKFNMGSIHASHFPGSAAAPGNADFENSLYTFRDALVRGVVSFVFILALIILFSL